MTWWIYVALLVNFIIVLLILIYLIRLQYYPPYPYPTDPPPSSAEDRTPSSIPVIDLSIPQSESTETEAIIYDEEDVQNPPSQNPSTSKEGYYKFKGLVREQAVCQTLESIYQKGFPTVRPSFLVNPETGELLEYDCYNSELKIAAEHNGVHHYQFPNKYHKTRAEFDYQVRKDNYKKSISDQYEIYLITVPYWVPTHMIPSWVEYYCPETVTTRENVEKLLVKYNN